MLFVDPPRTAGAQLNKGFHGLQQAKAGGMLNDMPPAFFSVSVLYQ